MGRPASRSGPSATRSTGTRSPSGAVNTPASAVSRASASGPGPSVPGGGAVIPASSGGEGVGERRVDRELVGEAGSAPADAGRAARSPRRGPGSSPSSCRWVRTSSAMPEEARNVTPSGRAPAGPDAAARPARRSAARVGASARSRAPDTARTMPSGTSSRATEPAGSSSDGSPSTDPRPVMASSSREVPTRRHRLRPRRPGRDRGDDVHLSRDQVCTSGRGGARCRTDVTGQT